MRPTIVWLVFILLYGVSAQDEDDLALTFQSFEPEIIFDEFYAKIGEEDLKEEPVSDPVMEQVKQLLQDENPLIEQMLQLAQGVGGDDKDSKLILMIDDPMDQIEEPPTVEFPEPVAFIQIGVTVNQEQPPQHFIDENVPEYATLQSPQSESKIVYNDQYKAPKVVLQEEREDAELIEDEEKPNWVAQSEFLVGAMTVFLTITVLWQTEEQHLRRHKMRFQMESFIRRGLISCVRGTIDTTLMASVDGNATVCLRVHETEDSKIVPEQVLTFPMESYEMARELHNQRVTILGAVNEYNCLVPVDIHMRYDYSEEDEEIPGKSPVECDDELCMAVRTWSEWSEWKGGDLILECLRGHHSLQHMVRRMVPIDYCTLNVVRLIIFIVMSVGVQLFFVPIYQVLQLFPIFGGLLDELGVFIGLPVGILFSLVFCLTTAGVSYCFYKPKLGAFLIMLALSICVTLVACTHLNLQLSP